MAGLYGDLTADQKKRKAGKSRYFWKDRAGKWHYHVEGKTTTDELRTKSEVFKNKDKSGSKPRTTATNAGAQNEGRPTTGISSTRSTVQATARPTNAQAAKAAVKSFRKENPADPKGAYNRSFKSKKAVNQAASSNMQKGVSAKLYDTAKSRLLSRKRKRGYS